MTIVTSFLYVNATIKLAIIPEIYIHLKYLIFVLIIVLIIAMGIKVLSKYYTYGKIDKVLFILILLLILMPLGVHYYTGPSIKITSPDNKAPINKIIDIEGEAKRIPEGAHIWAMVYGYPPTNRYFPQSQLIYPDPDGRWSLRGINVGDDTDSGDRFDIVVLLANDNAHNSLIDYMKYSAEIGAWQGLEEIPSGAKELDRITVTRA